MHGGCVDPGPCTDTPGTGGTVGQVFTLTVTGRGTSVTDGRVTVVTTNLCGRLDSCVTGYLMDVSRMTSGWGALVSRMTCSGARVVTGSGTP